MAFKNQDLSVLSYANSFTLWHYTTPDLSVATAGYFNDASQLLRRGDVIIATLDTADTPSTLLYVVHAHTGTTVTLAAIT